MSTGCCSPYYYEYHPHHNDLASRYDDRTYDDRLRTRLDPHLGDWKVVPCRNQHLWVRLRLQLRWGMCIVHCGSTWSLLHLLLKSRTVMPVVHGRPSYSTTVRMHLSLTRMHF